MVIESIMEAVDTPAVPVECVDIGLPPAPRRTGDNGPASSAEYETSRKQVAGRDSQDQTLVSSLVAGAARGDQDSWNMLVDRFASTVWAIARGHRLNHADAGDVFQTTWLRLLEHLDQIRQPERVGAWLATTARRECLRVLRIGGRQVPNGGDFEILADPGTSRSPDSDLVAIERQEILNRLVDQLPLRSQLLLRMLSVDSPLSYIEIGEALSMPVGSIGPTRARALEQLRRLAIREGVDLEEIFFS
jgi:RNA polymerase sigma factor (sigma-70 family)